LGRSGELEIRADALSLEAQPEDIREIKLNCSAIRNNEGNFCPNGRWELQVGKLHSDQPFSMIEGEITSATWGDDGFDLAGRVAAMGLESRLLLEQRDESLLLKLEWFDQDLMSLKDFRGAPVQTHWLTRGKGSGRAWLRWEDAGESELRYEFELDELGFDSPEGRFAGESLQVTSEGVVTPGEPVLANIKGSILSGELLADDFYRNFSGAPMDFETQAELGQSVIDVPIIHVTDHTALWLQGSAVLDLDADAYPLTFRISHLDLSFPLAYDRYIEPVLAVWTLNGLDMGGRVSWSGNWVGGKFESGELLLKDVTIVDGQRGRFAVTGLEGILRPGDHEFDSSLAWRGLLFGRLNLGEGDMALDSRPGRVAIKDPLELEVLGGQLVFHELGADLPGSMASVEQELDFQLRADLVGLDMELLTAAMDWPAFSGEITGGIPAVSLDEGVLTVDGEIFVEVFDGRIVVSDLSIERPFGVLPSLAATADIHDLDLEQLTQTFSFGQISGRMDGYIHDLRMLDWKPVAFDAWFGTPERQGKSNDISRNAVNRLTTIGGGSATAALTGPIMKLFNNFSYRRLGLGCRLHDNVCDLRGISEDEASVLIMEGSGLPKIMIRAFNRSLDWQQLLAGLVAVSGDEKIKVGD
jgi:hypothetical protein